METGTTHKRGLAAIWRLCPGRHALALLAAAVIALQRLIRPDRALNAGQSAYILCNLSSLVYHAGRVFADEVEDGVTPLMAIPYDGIDSKIKREQWAKDHGVNPTMG